MSKLLDSKLTQIKLQAKLDKMKKRAGFVVQSLLFDKDKFSVKQARAWAKKHGYSFKKVDNTDKKIRFRQKQPKKFKTFKTITLTEGIKAIVAGDPISKFAAQIYMPKFSKFSERVIRDETDIMLPLKVEMKILKEGRNRDGTIRREDLEESLSMWADIPIIDWHDDSNGPTIHKISNRKGFLSSQPRIEIIDGVAWVVNEAHITDRYTAYLIYLADKQGKPYEVSAEFASLPQFIGTEKVQTILKPHLVTITDEGHIKGNEMRVAA